MSDVSEIGAQIVIDRRVGLRMGIGLAIFVVIQFFALGYTYATGEWRLSALEADAPVLKQVNERTIRMEVELGFIRKAVEGRTSRP